MAVPERLGCGCPRAGYTVRAAGAYVVARSTYVPSCALGTHAHGDDRVVLTAYGGFGSHYGSRTFALDAQRTIYRPANVEHRDTYACETACITIRMPLSDGGRPAFDFPDDELPSTTRRLWAELDACDAASEFAIESLSAEILGRLASRPDREAARPRWLRVVRDRLEDEYANPPTLRAIARDAGRDVSHVATTFRKTYGRSIGAFVRDVRMWRTRPLVSDTSIPLAEVAARGGFADQSHFSRQFKARFGMTPGEYRRRAS